MIYYLHATGREDPNAVSFALIAWIQIEKQDDASIINCIVERKISGDMRIASSYSLFPVKWNYDPREQQKLCEAATHDAEPKPLSKASTPYSVF
jgi:hypothetical protein